jgi:hypothetical protein
MAHGGRGPPPRRAAKHAAQFREGPARLLLGTGPGDQRFERGAADLASNRPDQACHRQHRREVVERFRPVGKEDLDLHGRLIRLPQAKRSVFKRVCKPNGPFTHVR